MLKKIFEAMFLIILALTIPAEFIGVMGMESDAGPWAWWLFIGCGVLQLIAIAVIKATHREGEQE